MLLMEDKQCVFCLNTYIYHRFAEILVSIGCGIVSIRSILVCQGLK